MHAGDPCASEGECNDRCEEASASCAAPAGEPCTDDGNPCTDDACDGAGSCGHTPNSAPCDDGVFCNGTDTCASAACSLHTGDPCASEGECNDRCEETSASCAVPAGEPCTNDGNPCTDDACDGTGACAHAPNSAPCDDGQFCNGTDTCSGGSCSVHAGDPCLDEVECAGVCDELGDLCLAPPGVACSDDGNPCTDDACDGAGACAHVPNDDSCDDGDACTLDDRCQDGVCTGGVAVECGACESCDAAVGCVLRPRPMCKATGAGYSRLRIRNGSPDSRDLVQWKWQRGAATEISELGAPASSDDYTLCIYGDPDAAAAESLLVATAPAAKQCNGRSCWKVGSRGLKYKDRERTPHGLTSIRVVPGADGRARVIVKGKAEHLSDRDGGLAPLPFSLPLTVQLQVDDGICWTARYQAATTNGVDALKARSE